MRTGLFCALALVLIIVIVGVGVVLRLRYENFETADFQPRLFTASVFESQTPVGMTASELPETDLIFVGDIMLDRSVFQKINTAGGGDFRFPFRKIKGVIESADIAIGNLEGPISDVGIEAGKLYSFRMRPEAAAALYDAGFDVLSLANNHLDDWGREAFNDTLNNLEKNGIVAAGAGRTLDEAYNPKILERNGARFAFLAFSDFASGVAAGEGGGIAVVGETKIKNAVKDVRQKADLVAVVYHFGEEYIQEPTPRQRRLAQLAIDEGADLVVGSHPHVIQPLEKYKSGYIAYSLGNFVFDQSFSKETMTGGLLRAVVRDKKIESIKLFKVRLNNNYQPELE